MWRWAVQNLGGLTARGFISWCQMALPWAMICLILMKRDIEVRIFLEHFFRVQHPVCICYLPAVSCLAQSMLHNAWVVFLLQNAWSIFKSPLELHALYKTVIIFVSKAFNLKCHPLISTCHTSEIFQLLALCCLLLSQSTLLHYQSRKIPKKF